jgi:hypothetical protein
MATPHLNPSIGVAPLGSSENEKLVFCEHSTSPLVVSKALMEAVCNQVNASIWPMPGERFGEVGGLLVGAKGSGDPLTVEQIVPISTEQRFGRAFRLSPISVKGLQKAIASAHDDQTRTVIGFYRSRILGDAIPRETDQEILKTLARIHPAYEVDFRFFVIFTPLSKFVLGISIAQRCDTGWKEWHEFEFRRHPGSPLLDVSETESPVERTKYPGSPLLDVSETESPVERTKYPAPPLLDVSQTESPMERTKYPEFTMEQLDRAPVSASRPSDTLRAHQRASRPRLWLYGVIGLLILMGVAGIYWNTTHRSERVPLSQGVAGARESAAAGNYRDTTHQAERVALPQSVAVTKGGEPMTTPPQSKAKTGLPAREPSHTLRLRGRSPIVVLASDASAASELKRHPGMLAKFVRDGSVFSVSSSTAITMQEKKHGLIKVLIMEGAMAGKEGWVAAGKVFEK